MNAFIIFGQSKQFKDDDDEFQRRVNACIIFGPRFKGNDDEFQKCIHHFWPEVQRQRRRVSEMHSSFLAQGSKATTTSFRDAFIIFGPRFKGDDNEFQRRVNAFIIFGLTKQFKDDDEFQRCIHHFWPEVQRRQRRVSEMHSSFLA